MTTASVEPFSPSACREWVRAWHCALLRTVHCGRADRHVLDDLAAIKAVLASEGDVFSSAASFAAWMRDVLLLTPEEAQTWLTPLRGHHE